MARRSTTDPTTTSGDLSPLDALLAVGLRRGQRARFRKTPGGQRWMEGTVAGIDGDGSLGLYDTRGRRRSIPFADIEVLTEGPRGGRVWRPLPDVVGDAEQLGLFGP